MGKIVAIGGGELRNGETQEINKFIVELSRNDTPRLLFIPTASEDSEGYIKLIKRKFGDLGCIVDELCLVSGKYNDKEIKQKILGSQIIYVGGGNTVRMMGIWKDFEVDTYLKEAYRKGIVLSGLSAGSICWFVYGHSDSNKFINQGQWDYTRAYGLGIISATHCPHYNEEGREGYDLMMQDEILPGIALENNTALAEINCHFYIIKEDKNRKAYKLKKSNGQLLKTELYEGEFTLN